MYFTYFIFVSLSLSFFTLSLHCLLCLLRYEGKNRQGHWVCCHVDAYNKQFYVKTTPSSYHVITMFSTLKGRTGIGGWWLMILVLYESYVRVLPVSLRTIIVVYTIPYLKTQDTTIYHTWYIHTVPYLVLLYPVYYICPIYFSSSLPFVTPINHWVAGTSPPTLLVLRARLRFRFYCKKSSAFSSSTRVESSTIYNSSFGRIFFSEFGGIRTNRPYLVPGTPE